MQKPLKKAKTNNQIHILLLGNEIKITFWHLICFSQLFFPHKNLVMMKHLRCPWSWRYTTFSLFTKSVVSAQVSLTFCAQKLFTPNVYSALKNSSINSDSRITACLCLHLTPAPPPLGEKKIIEGIWRSAFLTPNENKHFHTWPKRPRNFLHTDFQAYFGLLTRKRKFHQAWFFSLKFPHQCNLL